MLEASRLAREQPARSERKHALSAEAARELLEGVMREDARGSGEPLPAVFRELAERHRAVTLMDEPLLRELVQSLLLIGLQIPHKARLCVADVTAAVSRSIWEDEAAIQRVQAWWAQLRGGAA